MPANTQGQVAARALACFSACDILHSKRLAVVLPSSLGALAAAASSGVAASQKSEQGDKKVLEGSFEQLNKAGQGPGGPDRVLPPPCLAKRIVSRDVQLAATLADNKGCQEPAEGPSQGSSDDSGEAAESRNEAEDVQLQLQRGGDERREEKNIGMTTQVRLLPPPQLYSAERLVATAAAWRRYAGQTQHNATQRSPTQQHSEKAATVSQRDEPSAAGDEKAADYTAAANAPLTQATAERQPQKVRPSQAVGSLKTVDPKQTKNPRGRPPKKPKLQKQQPPEPQHAQPQKAPQQQQVSGREQEQARACQQPASAAPAPLAGSDAACTLPATTTAPAEPQLAAAAAPKKRGRPFGKASAAGKGRLSQKQR